MKPVVLEIIERRAFIKKSLLAGLAAAVGGPILGRSRKAPAAGVSNPTIDLAVATGNDYALCAFKAVDMLGGMKRFVTQDSRVALLANAQSSHPGTFTCPAIVRAAIRMCQQAGAKEVNLLSWLALKNWESAGLAQVAADEGAGLRLIDRNEVNFRPVAITGGKVLQEARLMNAFFEHDVLINMPVTKDHAGNRFTGTLKNLMGLNSPGSNRGFHKENWSTDLSAVEFLDQCIVDLNTVIRPALCLVDATEFITTNGPFGPGELLKPRKVVAGIDRIAIDTYCASLWGLEAEDIFMLKHGYEQKLGEIDLKKVRIKETAV